MTKLTWICEYPTETQQMETTHVRNEERRNLVLPTAYFISQIYNTHLPKTSAIIYALPYSPKPYNSFTLL